MNLPTGSNIEKKEIIPETPPPPKKSIDELKYDRMQSFGLTTQEMAIVRCFMHKNLTSAEVGSLLHIHEKTVKFHLTSIYQKTRTTGRMEMLRVMLDGIDSLPFISKPSVNVDLERLAMENRISKVKLEITSLRRTISNITERLMTLEGQFSEMREDAKE